MNTTLYFQNALRNGRLPTVRKLNLIAAGFSTRSSTLTTPAASPLQHQEYHSWTHSPTSLHRQQQQHCSTPARTTPKTACTRSFTATPVVASSGSGGGGAAGASAGAAAAGQACPTTIARPPLSPLPFIYLRNLPYGRSTSLQERLVERQIRLRKQREEQRAKIAVHSDNDHSQISTPPSKEDGSQDLILLVEHLPTYTNGRRNRGERSIDEQESTRLERLGATYVESLRGGEITFHGPGQLVAYPILDLKPAKLSVKCYVSYLEKAIIATCAEWGVETTTTENTGVWINDQKKIAAIGVQVQRYITSHGLALNCSTDLDFFKEIVACGLVGKETTSLSRELKDPSTNVEKVIPTFLKGFGATFNRTLIPLCEVNPDLEKLIHEYVQNGTASFETA